MVPADAFGKAADDGQRGACVLKRALEVSLLVLGPLGRPRGAQLCLRRCGNYRRIQRSHHVSTVRHAVAKSRAFIATSLADIGSWIGLASPHIARRPFQQRFE